MTPLIQEAIERAVARGVPLDAIVSSIEQAGKVAEPAFRVRVTRMVESIGTSYLSCIERSDRPKDAGIFSREGIVYPYKTEHLENALHDAQSWADFLQVPLTPYKEPHA